MKTRHILTALALPALFAACTADEFESADFSNVEQARARLSKDFALIIDSEAETRYAAEGTGSLKFTFSADDKIGAAIIDNYSSTYPNEPEKWDVIYSLAGNYPFKNVGGDTWQSDTELGIGHYLFLHPYNPKDNNRAAAIYELPTIQNLYDENGAFSLNAAVSSGNKAIGAALLREGETSKTISLKNLFTYPKFVINFDNGEKVTTVTQVVLKSEGGFLVKGGYDHKAISTLFNEGTNADATINGKKLNTKAYWDAKAEAIDWDKVQTEDLLITESTKGVEFGKPVREPYLIAKLPEGTKVQLDNNTQNKYVEVRFMMPSIADFTDLKASAGSTNADIEMLVYTDNGVYKVDFVNDSFSFGATTSAEQIETAFARSRSNTLRLKALTSADRTNEVETIVTNVADWNTLVANYGASANSQTIAIVGNNFAFDATAKMPSKAEFKINTPVSVKGNVTMQNVTVNDKVTVEAGATLTTTSSFKAGEVENNGTLTFTAQTDAQGNLEAYKGVGTVINAANVTVPANVEVAFALANEANATVTVAEDGILTVEDAKKTEKLTEVGNYGTINNKGSMNVAGLTNNVKDLDNNPKNGYEVIGRIVNEGEIMSIATDGLVNNENAEIVNKGEMTCSNTQHGTIVNNGTLDANGIVTYITTNNGIVISPEAQPTKIIITSQLGTVEYTATKAAETFKGSIVTKVIANGNLTISDKGNVKEVEMSGSSTLALPATAATLDKLTVTAGITTLGSGIEVEDLTVKSAAKIIVPEKTTLKITDSLDNEGSILVGGTFNSVTLQEDGGIVKESGANASIKWNINAADPDADYKTALQKAVAEYIDNNDLYKNNGYEVKLENFAAALENVNPSNSTHASKYPNLIALKAMQREVTETELTDAVEAVKADAKEGLVKALDAATFLNQSNYYKNDAATDGKTGEAKAIADFKDKILKQSTDLIAAWTGIKLSESFAVSELSDDELKAYIEDNAIYVWEGCTLESLIAIWKTYDKKLGDKVDGYEHSDATTAEIGKRLVGWVNIVLSTSSTGTPNLSAAQTKLANLGINAETVDVYGKYSDAQFAAVDATLTVTP